MVIEEIDIFEKLKSEVDAGAVSKGTALKARDIYNESNEEQITNCMCNKIRRQILSREMLEWYEGEAGRIHTT